jgi:hypothetical protein
MHAPPQRTGFPAPVHTSAQSGENIMIQHRIVPSLLEGSNKRAWSAESRPEGLCTVLGQQELHVFSCMPLVNLSESIVCMSICMNKSFYRTHDHDWGMQAQHLLATRKTRLAPTSFCSDNPCTPSAIARCTLLAACRGAHHSDGCC